MNLSDFSKSYQEDSKVNKKEVDLQEQDDVDHIFSSSAYAAIGSSLPQANQVQNVEIKNQVEPEMLQSSKESQKEDQDLVEEKKDQIDHFQVEEEKARESVHSNVMNLLDSGEDAQPNQNIDLISFENYGDIEIDSKYLDRKRIENANKEILENNINNLLEYAPDNADDLQNSQLFDIQAQTTALSAKMLLESSIQSNHQLQISQNSQPEVQKNSQQIELQKQGSSNSQKNLITNLHQNIIFEDEEELEAERDNESMQLYKERDQIIGIDKSLMINRIIIVCEPELITEGYITTYKLYRVKSKIQQYSGFDSEVLRRFSDFEWLYNELVNKYGGYLIPLLPEKNILTKFNIETANFTKDRQKNLEFFLQKLLDHQKLQSVPELKLFLFAKNEVFSLVKGEAESQKTIEQKYQNVIGSVKNYIQQSIVPFFGYSQEKGQEIIREQTELDKDLNNYEAYIQNLAQKMSNFLKVYESHFNIMEEELKYLNELNSNYSKYIESTQKDIKMGNRNQKQNQNSESSKSNLINQKLINLKEDYVFKWRNQFYPQLEVWYKNCIAAQEALNRRKEIIITIVNHTKRIQELNLQNKKNNNQRDTETDILYNNLVKNQQKLENINKILVTEIKEFDENQQQQFEQMINLFIEIEKDFNYKQNEIYHGREPNII